MSSGGGKNNHGTDTRHSGTRASGSNSARSVSRSRDGGPGETSASDTESARGTKDKERRGAHRAQSARSKDSSRGSSKSLSTKDVRESREGGRAHRRTASQGQKKDIHDGSNSSANESGEVDSHATDSGIQSGRSGSRKSDRTRSVGKESSFSDSGLAKDKSLTPEGSTSKGDVSLESMGEDLSASAEDVGGNHKTSRATRPMDPNSPLRLLILSSKIKNSMTMQHALVGNVILVNYKYESSTLESLLNNISQQLQSVPGRKIETIAFIVHSSTSVVYLTGKDDKQLNKESLAESSGVRDFFTNLVNSNLDFSSGNTRLDFLACNMAQSADGQAAARGLEHLLNVPVGISKDVTGADITIDSSSSDSKSSFVGELYFKVDRLRNWSAHNQQTLAGFEKIRTVGKGAYGTAVLYRKKDDDSLVILKEINLHDLNASERQLALNEVKVLAMLDHPNIISYYDSFEEDGIVMIEMEYADGGTLAQHLAQQDKPLEEREILAMFQQVVAAIKHIHEHSILHRDLKTANIFLTKEGVVKVGDFGISKLMSTANQANTVLGTPYYISPEMCEGKAYNEKSDIWALGCILYEMACLQKTFEGSNLPALVNKIMKGQFAPVKETYSAEFKRLIQDMLQREPEYRPSSVELWHNRLPEMLSKFEDPTTDYEDDCAAADANNIGRRRKTRSKFRSYIYRNELLFKRQSYIRIIKSMRSVLYYFEMSSMSLMAIGLPSKLKIRDVAVGSDHVLVVSMERMVFTWGEGSKGQLGHGVLESRYKPQAVEALRGKSIVRACCGSGFSVFASDNGIVMTCGDGTFGCLGHGDWCSTSRPRLIEALLSVDVIAIGCGPEHVVAVGSDGEVFSWGKAADGRLGLGNDEDMCQPTEVSFQDTVCVRDVRCGLDGTMLITDVGSVLACGNNEYNKLGLNQRQGFLMAMKNIFNKTEVEGQKVFTLVKALSRHRVVDISMGPDHSAVVVEPGHVYTLGRNSEGQLGNGNTKQQNAPIGVKIFEEKPAFRVQCGPHCSIGGTTDNELVFWGLRYKSPPQLKLDESLTSNASEGEPQKGGTATPAATPSDTSLASVREVEGSLESVNREPASARGVTLEKKNSEESDEDERASSGGFRPLSSTRKRKTVTSSNTKDREKDSRDDYELILHPTPLLRMDSSGSHSEAGDTVTLSNFYCHGENLFIEVETTAPPPKRKSRKRRNFRKRFNPSNLEVPEESIAMSASSREGGDEYSSEASEHDTYGTIPAWIKEELAHRELANDDNEADVSDEEVNNNFHPDSSLTSIQINKDLRKAGKMAPAMLATGPKIAVGSKDLRAAAAVRKSSRLVEGAEVKSAVSESGADFAAADTMSSISSGEAVEQNFSHGDKAKAASPVKKVSSTTPRKVSAPVPYKSKMGPAQGQKPLNRIRANKQRSRGSGEIPKDAAIDKGEMNATKVGTQSLMLELEKMKEEKRKTEERLRAMEDEHRKQQELLQQQQLRASSENEVALKDEILNLRSELKQQSHKLQDNYQVVLSLQEQLEKVKSEQMRQSAREVQQRAQSMSSVQKESRICALQ